MTKVVIALASVRGRSGKDTLIEELRKAGHQVTRVAFGDTLKVACASELASSRFSEETLLEFFHSNHKDVLMDDLRVTSLPQSDYKDWLLGLVTDPSWNQEPRSPRWHLQMYGTEYRREFYNEPDVWLNAGLKEIEKSPAGLVVVSDLRQRNEYAKLLRTPGLHVNTVWLHRMWFVPGVDDAPYHKTDLDLLGRSMDAVVLNEWGSPSDMVTQLEKQLGGL